MTARPEVILLPGGVLPAEQAFAPLLQALGTGANAAARELELYADETPPPGYSLDLEAEGLLRAAASGFDRFQLVGYFRGGPSSLAFAASHPEQAAQPCAPRAGMGRQRASTRMMRRSGRSSGGPPASVR